MGIKQLMNIINEKAPSAVRKVPLEQFSGRTIACDASMAMYQFLIATQYAQAKSTVTDETGNPTSHILGLFHRTIQFLEYGIKPIWVFDGRPPVQKENELLKRKDLKKSNKQKLIEAQVTPFGMEGVKRKPFTKSQTYMIQKTKYSEEVLQTEDQLRSEIAEIVGYRLPSIRSGDFIFRGESDEEEIGEYRQVEQMLTNIEKRGTGRFNQRQLLT